MGRELTFSIRLTGPGVRALLNHLQALSLEKERQMEDEAKVWARTGYEAYARFTGGKTYDGKDMPSWENLTPRIQDAWTEAAKAIEVASRVDALLPA